MGIYIDGIDNVLMEYDTLSGNLCDLRIGFGSVNTDSSDHTNNWTDSLIVRYCISTDSREGNIGDDGSCNAQFYYNVFETANTSVTHDIIYMHSDGGGSYNMFAPMNSKYYNNTFIEHQKGSFFHIYSDGTCIADNITFINNIFYYDSPTSPFVYHSWGTPTKTFVFDNNIWYSTNSSYTWKINGNSTSTFSTWQGWGYDVNGRFANPLFTNIEGGVYTLQSESPAINSGANVGLTKDINSNLVPSYFPDMGAYQHNSGKGGGWIRMQMSTLSLNTAIPKDFDIGQNYPNPFNPSTKIDYQVPTDAKVILEVYNIAGQKVAELVNQEQTAGFYTVNFGSSDKLASGVYIYRMTANDKATGKFFSETKKMMLLK
jgi:hypothetical protein